MRSMRVPLGLAERKVKKQVHIIQVNVVFVLGGR